MNMIKRYDAYLTFATISDQQQVEIRNVMEKQGLDIDVFDNALEFAFEGRDLSDKIVESFVEIAKILGDASGEIRCESDDEASDPTFKFYTISESCLWVQNAEIVRSTPKSRVT